MQGGRNVEVRQCRKTPGSLNAEPPADRHAWGVGGTPRWWDASLTQPGSSGLQPPAQRKRGRSWTHLRDRPGHVAGASEREERLGGGDQVTVLGRAAQKEVRNLNSLKYNKKPG